MKVSRRTVAAGLGLLTASTALGSAQAEGLIHELTADVEDLRAASEAYIYGYPLVTMEMTRRVMTNVATAEGTRAPMGQLVRLRTYPDASFRDVTAPNRLRHPRSISRPRSSFREAAAPTRKTAICRTRWSTSCGR